MAWDCLSLICKSESITITVRHICDEYSIACFISSFACELMCCFCFLFFHITDAVHGSKLTFKTRIHLCLIAQVVCLLIAPFAGYYGLIILSMLIGCATWVAHSCTTSLSGMVKSNSSIMQQIGFALPAVFGIVTSLAFNLSDDDIPDLNIILFFFSIALFVLPGIVCWVSWKDVNIRHVFLN